MKKIDVIRMIASMPDETQIYFDDGTQVITIDRAEYVKGKLVFSVAPVSVMSAIASEKINQGDPVYLKDGQAAKPVKDGEYKVKASKKFISSDSD